MDWAFQDDPKLSPADRAVKYLLDRLQRDPDLRWFCGPLTQSFRMLCEAEAARLGLDVESVIEKRRNLLIPDHHDRRSRVEIMEKRIDQLERQLSNDELAKLERRESDEEARARRAIYDFTDAGMPAFLTR